MTMQAAVRGDDRLDAIVRKLRGAMPELRERYGVKSLGIFGSCARGEESLSSDLDILVEFEAAPGFFRFVDMEDYLSGLVGMRVDLVMKSALRPNIGRRILSEVVSV